MGAPGRAVKRRHSTEARIERTVWWGQSGVSRTSKPVRKDMNTMLLAWEIRVQTWVCRENPTEEYVAGLSRF